MTVDFQQVNQQVRELGEKAGARQDELDRLHAEARQLLELYASEFLALRARVERVVREVDQNLRCAQPADPDLMAPEALTAHFPPPTDVPPATIIAADGSQIPYDRHLDVEYCLINVGVIQMYQASGAAPETTIYSKLLYDQDLYTKAGTITEASLALMRDKLERSVQAGLAELAVQPVVTFTDGPMELWGAKNSESEAAGYQKHLEDYIKVLQHLQRVGAVAGGYVDKPSADLVVRLLELIRLPEDNLAEAKNNHYFRGVRDFEFYRQLLGPGERSAVFAIQSQSKDQYPGELGLHFFYLNVGRAGRPWVARVEIPAWVAKDSSKLGLLHAVIVGQCQITGTKPYPYLLHRAHETAVVTLEERDQVTQMITQELRRRGVEPGEKSFKQFYKDAQGRTGYKR